MIFLFHDLYFEPYCNGQTTVGGKPACADTGAALGHPAARAAVPLARTSPETRSFPVVPADDIRFRRLDLSQGLSQTRVAQILQDDQGFMWFGTQYGLNRFDGRGFRVFKHDAARPDSLSGVFIYALFKDRRGRICVGSDQGLDVYESATETFRHIALDTRDPIVIHISQTSDDGMLWLATSQGLYRLDPVTGEHARFGHDPTDPLSLPSDDIKSSGEDRAGAFWVASSKGLDAFDRVTGRVTLHIPFQVSVREFSFHEDRFGTSWIIYGSGNGLALFDKEKNQLTRYQFHDREISDTSLTGVYAILEAQDGTIWLGTMGAGLLKYDRDRHRFVSYRNLPTNPESLAENRVIALYEDSEGNIWTGLHGSPPNSFPSIAPPFESLRTTTTHANSLGETLVNAIFEDSHGDLWLGAGGALNRLDRKTGDHQVVEPLGRGVPVEVLVILEDAAGTLWVGSLGAGLQRMDRSTGQFESLRHDPNDSTSISSDIVTRLFVDRAGDMWVTTWNGLDKRDSEAGQFTTFKRNPDASAEAYFSITEDRDGMLWLGSTTGLYRFDPKTGQFTAFAHDPEDASSLSNNTVNSVLSDRTGALWIGTQNGLNLLDPFHGTFKTYDEKDGLPGSAVACILEDGRGNLWMSTNHGVARMDATTRTFDNYATADGLPGNDLTGWDACYKSATGELFFGGFADATAIRPEKLTQSTYVPPVVLTELRLSGEPVEPWQPPLMGRSITDADSLVLTSRQNDFAIEFSALSFSSPDTNRYRYRLAGLDMAWHHVGVDRRAASFTTLPSGSYRFEVQAAVSRGPWTSPGATLEIVVLPPWWNTWWFRSAYIAAFALLLFAGYRYRLRQVAYQYRIVNRR